MVIKLRTYSKNHLSLCGEVKAGKADINNITLTLYQNEKFFKLLEIHLYLKAEAKAQTPNKSLFTPASRGSPSTLQTKNPGTQRFLTMTGDCSHQKLVNNFLFFVKISKIYFLLVVLNYSYLFTEV